MLPFDPAENIRKNYLKGDQKGTLGRKGFKYRILSGFDGQMHK